MVYYRVNISDAKKFCGLQEGIKFLVIIFHANFFWRAFNFATFFYCKKHEN